MRKKSRNYALFWLKPLITSLCQRTWPFGDGGNHRLPANSEPQHGGDQKKRF